MAYNLTGVAVTGLVEHKRMWEQCKAEYEYSFGYHPDRDTPRYDFVQVQRRMVKEDGSVGEWGDLSKNLAKQSELYPNNFDTAPEIVHAHEYDGIITMPIPPLGMDYKALAMHPKSLLREFTVPEVEEDDTVEGDQPEFQDDKDDDNLAGGRNSQRRQSAIGSNNAGSKHLRLLQRTATPTTATQWWPGKAKIQF
jgi:hypothetical protein